jgi:hypothetical protein
MNAAGTRFDQKNGLSLRLFWLGASLVFRRGLSRGIARCYAGPSHPMGVVPGHALGCRLVGCRGRSLVSAGDERWRPARGARSGGGRPGPGRSQFGETPQSVRASGTGLESFRLHPARVLREDRDSRKAGAQPLLHVPHEFGAPQLRRGCRPAGQEALAERRSEKPLGQPVRSRTSPRAGSQR